MAKNWKFGESLLPLRWRHIWWLPAWFGQVRLLPRGFRSNAKQKTWDVWRRLLSRHLQVPFVCSSAIDKHCDILHVCDSVKLKYVFFIRDARVLRQVFYCNWNVLSQLVCYDCLKVLLGFRLDSLDPLIRHVTRRRETAEVGILDCLQKFQDELSGDCKDAFLATSKAWISTRLVWKDFKSILRTYIVSNKLGSNDMYIIVLRRKETKEANDVEMWRQVVLTQKDLGHQLC